MEAAISPTTRLIVISHVTSATACVLPVHDICRMAQRKRIPVCIDGPHALALLDVRLDEIGCDFYCASGHKWLCGPFGSGFLWVHPRQQSQLQTPVVSWGGSIAGKPASWKDGLQWLGTRDPAPLLALADAIRFFTPDVICEYRRHAPRADCGRSTIAAATARSGCFLYTECGRLREYGSSRTAPDSWLAARLSRPPGRTANGTA